MSLLNNRGLMRRGGNETLKARSAHWEEFNLDEDFQLISTNTSKQNEKGKTLVLVWFDLDDAETIKA